MTLPAVALYIPKSPKSMARDVSRKILDKYSPVLKQRKVEKQIMNSQKLKMKKSSVNKFRKSSIIYE